MIYKISIIIPVFNAEKYLEEALNSILSQTIGFKELEVIMVNDCSTDNTAILINEYAEKYENFKAIHLEENSGGSGKPRNVGIEKATGDYIMFLDSDDSYTKDACELLYKNIHEKDVDMVFSKYIISTDNSKNRPVYTFFGELDRIEIDNIDEDPRLLKLAPSVWTKIYRKKFILDNKIKFSEKILAEDLAFVVETFLKAKGIIFLNNHFCYNYRIHSPSDPSLSNNITEENMFKLIDGYHETYEILINNNKKSFLPFVFNSHLEFWADEFIKNKSQKAKKIEMLQKISFLFQNDEFIPNPEKKYLINLFTCIRNKKYERALLISESINEILISQKSLIMYQDELISQINDLESEKNILETELNEQKLIMKSKEKKFKDDLKFKSKELNKLKNEMQQLLTIRGYSKYKTTNIASRIKKRFS